MLKHRKNVALHAQFFARLRYRERRADTSYRDCATSLPKAKNHSSASFFLSLVRLAAFRGMLSVDFNSGRASKRSRLKKSAKICGICGKLKFRLRLSCDPSNIQIVLGTISIDSYSEIGVADAYFNAVNSAKICAICGKLKFRLGLPMRSF
jgi:hypothetical protein